MWINVKSSHTSNLQKLEDNLFLTFWVNPLFLCILVLCLCICPYEGVVFPGTGVTNAAKWVLRFEPVSSGRAASVFNQWAISSPAHRWILRFLFNCVCVCVSERGGGEEEIVRLQARRLRQSILRSVLAYGIFWGLNSGQANKADALPHWAFLLAQAALQIAVSELALESQMTSHLGWLENFPLLGIPTWQTLNVDGWIQVKRERNGSIKIAFVENLGQEENRLITFRGWQIARDYLHMGWYHQNLER